jgi:hypothetical protein
MILSSYLCPTCGEIELMVSSPSPDVAPCDCGAFADWLPSPIHGSVQASSVVRGTVAKPDSPMFLDTRELGEGMPLKEFKEKRRKLYEERRHKEGKGL